MDTAQAINQDIDDFRDPDGSPDEELLHDRTYRVRAYRRSASQMRIRGMVRDIKPMIMWVETGRGDVRCLARRARHLCAGGGHPAPETRF